MAAFNISLDDSSPLISYSGGWTDTPSNDTIIQSYAAQSMHTTAQPGASATFKFNGTGVWFFGGMRPNYGSYALSVDGQTVKSDTVNSTEVQISQLLGGALDLGMGEHTAVLTNSGSLPIDLDGILFETQIGPTGGQTVQNTTADDNDSDIVYISASDWSVSNNSVYSGGSLHSAQKDGANASFSFIGDAIEILGGSSFDHGDYEISLDGQIYRLNGGSNGAARVYHAQTLLFFATNLGSDTHNVTITSRGGDDTPFVDLDSITIYQASNSTDDESGEPMFGISQAQESTDTPGGLSKPMVVGLVVAILLAVLFLIILVIALIARNRHKKLKKKNKAAQMASPVLPFQDPDLEAGEGYFKEKKMPIPEPAPVIARKPASLKRYQLQDNPRPGLPPQPDAYVATQPRPSLERTRTVASRWSQSSFASTDSTLTDYYRDDVNKSRELIPPVPLLPNVAPLAVRTRPDTMHTQATSMHDSLHDFVDYYQESRSVSTISNIEVPKTPPARPVRPADMELDLRGTRFDSIPL